MSSTPYASIELEFKPAWLLLALFVAWLLGVVVAIAQLAWPIAIRCSLAGAALLVGGRGILSLANGLANGAVQRAVWSADGAWRLVDGAGRTWQSRLESSARCWNRLGFLVWHDGATRRRAIVTRSSVGADSFCRLRVRMRYELPCETRSGPRM
ncbi:MAG TPA: hypothetical protein VEZ88_06250 [Steroidobacteraceae bacterium]|nr:hypothetical protein [Steroidobacteraceae bacterium]